MNSFGKKITAFACGVVLLYGIYHVYEARAREEALRNAKPFECRVLYELPQIWRCGMKSESTPTFNVDSYVTLNTIGLQH